MATFSPVEYTAQTAVPPTPLDPTQDKGRVRIAHFDLTGIVSGSIGDVIQCCKLPAGKVRVLRYCNKHGSWAASSTFSLGNAAYTRSSDKTTVAASATSVAAAVTMNNSTDVDVLAGVVFDSTTGVLIQGTVAGAAGGTLPSSLGWIEYVQD
jgi:hypothetical protein